MIQSRVPTLWVVPPTPWGPFGHPHPDYAMPISGLINHTPIILGSCPLDPVTSKKLVRLSGAVYTQTVTTTKTCPVHLHHTSCHSGQFFTQGGKQTARAGLLRGLLRARMDPSRQQSALEQTSVHWQGPRPTRPETLGPSAPLAPPKEEPLLLCPLSPAAK